MTVRTDANLSTGSAIVHPLFDRPSSENGQMLFTDVSHFENAVGFTDVLHSMLRLVFRQALVSFNQPTYLQLSRSGQVLKEKHLFVAAAGSSNKCPAKDRDLIPFVRCLPPAPSCQR